MSNDSKKNGHAHKTNGSAHPAALPESPAAEAMLGAEPSATPESLSVHETLRGRRILVTGATGFLGKVYVSMLLRFHPDIEQLYLLIRDRRDASASDRLVHEILESPALDPLREIYGEGFDEFVQEKVSVLAGDITQPHLGLAEDEARALSSKLDVLVNSAGLTNFNPNLKSALEINTLSSNHLLEFIRLGGSRARLLHVSTAFVAGRANGPTPEEVPTSTVYPRYEELEAPLDVERELDDCLAMIEHAEQLADDQERQSLLTKQARDWLREHNLNPHDERQFASAYAQKRKAWIKSHLSQRGRERADHWGWVNIYTYTKSLGERLLVERADEIGYTIFRPAIIESAEAYPTVGWNEGMNTSAPICYLAYKGHRFIPTRDLNLDVIPIDYVVGGMLAITAALIADEYDSVYHCGSSDRNPMSMPRIVELTSLGARQIRNRDTSTKGLQKLVLKTFDAVPVDPRRYNRQSAPALARAARGVQSLVDRMPTRSLGGLGKALEAVQKTARKTETMAATVDKIFEIFLPFIYENDYIFRARNIETLRAKLRPDERARYGCAIENLDWRKYWLESHMPGLAKYVFPHLEAKLRERGKSEYSYQDLVDLFEASASNFATRTAMQHHDGGVTERYTYAELKEHADRAAKALQQRGIGAGHSVILLSENRPQWGMAYFGILKAGATAVPVDPDSSAAQIVNLAQSARASMIVLSEAAFARVGEDVQRLAQDEDLALRVVTFPALFELHTDAALATDTEDRNLPVPAALFEVEGRSADEIVASLIFTSGTTGAPKGVMLTHRNFTSLLDSLEGMFSVSERDGFLSVLPLHHTFEFTCGLLMPLSRGATITYLEELSGDELRHAMQSTPVSALIGVPALWQLLHRRIEQNVASAGPQTKWLFDRMLQLNGMLRRRLGINLGPLLFGPVHRTFGNRMRYMISGGAALPPNVLETFYGLGFDMYEGYGLTEAAPVLTVNRPSDGTRAGSVGRPLPGIEIQIHEPDDQGVGEVIARGDNVMLGYLDRDEDTQRTLRDGWLHTGDLGKLDSRGRLTIVGRSKEVIVTAGGKNVYPDELEDIYGKCPNVLELSVVGLPDGQGSERVACLVRPDAGDAATSEEVAHVRAAIREWIRVEGARVAPHNRIQVLRFFDEEFPRTATRKIKRKEIVAILTRLQEAEASSSQENAKSQDWLDRAVATLAGVDAATIRPHTHFQDDLGFDSLMVVELASLLEARHHHVAPDDLTHIQTVGELREFLAGAGTALIERPISTIEKVQALPVHPVVARTGKKMLHDAQMWAYRELFDVEVFGRANIPYHNPNVIVVANHVSHLDMGLVKYALGDFGADIRTLAAADYFFKTTARKTYFKHFTNLIPVDRSGSPGKALDGAIEALRRGETILMFPEGTRAPDGKLRDFRRGLGYLVATQKVDVLPVWLEGTYQALPKGQPLPSPTRRRLKVRVGKLLPARELMAGAEAMGDSELYDQISARTRDAVATLSRVGQPDESKHDIQPLFAELNDKFERDQVDRPVSYYFSLGSVDTHKWTVIVDPEQCQIRQGKPDGGQADCVVKTSPELFRRIVQESYIPSFDEFMNGTIKTNSPDLLMRFQSVFRLQG